MTFAPEPALPTPAAEVGGVPASPGQSGLIVSRVRIDDPRVVQLIDQVQAEYVRLYGGPDRAPIDAGQFAGERGSFLLGTIDDVPVAMAGWRRLAAVPALPGTKCAEVKRMFVVESLRGRGLSKQMLAALEHDAREQGVEWLVLETGDLQPRAIALYRSHGFVDIDGFGWAEYYGEDGGVSLGKALT